MGLEGAFSGAAAGSSFGPWGAVAGGAIGLLAGQEGSATQRAGSNVSLGPQSALEKQASGVMSSGYTDLERILIEQYGQSNQASTAYGNLLQQYGQTGGMPSQADLTQGAQFAQQALAPQQAQIDLAMRQNLQGVQRQAALMGRSGTDFALQTRLGQQRNDLLSQLGAQQSAMGLDFARQMGQNRLNYAQQYAGLQQGLANQALENRMAIMRMGQGTLGQEQQFRLGGASQMTTQYGQPGTMLSGLTGALQGASAGMSIAGMFKGGGGTTSPSPQLNTLQMPSSVPASASSRNYLGNYNF